MKEKDIAIALVAFALVVGAGIWWQKRQAAAASAASPDPLGNSPWLSWPSVNAGTGMLT